MSNSLLQDHPPEDVGVRVAFFDSGPLQKKLTAVRLLDVAPGAKE